MYIRKGEKIQDELKQIFFYTPVPYGTVAEHHTMDMIREHLITPQDISVIQFLYKFQVATLDQIMQATGISDSTMLLKRIDFLVKQRMMNKFMICDESEVKIAPDAELIYTIDYAAIIVMRHMTSDQDCENWRADSLVMTSTKVNKALMNVDFYLALRRDDGDKLLYYNVHPLLSAGKNKYEPQAIFALNTPAGKKTFIFDDTRYADYYNGYTTKFTAKINRLENILVIGAWEKYSGEKDLPAILMMADNDDAMKRCAQLLSTTQISAVRYCTSDSIKGELNRAFYRYDDKEDALKRVAAKTF
jgi:hypothetical protein